MAFRCLRTAATMVRRISAPQLYSPKKIFLPQKIRTSFMDHYIPRSQYETPLSHKLQLTKVLNTYYELYPLFSVTAVAIFGVIFNTIWACLNKVDVVFSTHSRRNISRTMNLLAPTCHKLIVINPETKPKPWPEMARVLRMMKEEQCARALKHDTEC